MGWIARIRSVPPPEWVLILGLVGVAAAARFVGRHHVNSDMVVFEDWYDQLRAHGGIRGLSEPIGNYNAPFLYLLVLASYLPGAVLLKIKLIFVAFDALVVFFVYKLVGLRHPGWRLPTLAALVVALLPTVVVNASMWGQCDAIWAAFCLGGVYYLLADRQWAGVSLLAVAYAFKPQAIFVFPVLLLLLLGGRLRWRTLLALPVVYLALDVPALAFGRDPWGLITIYSDQVGQSDRLNRGAPGIWQFFPVTVGTDVLRNLGYLTAAGLVLGVCYVLIATRTRLDAQRVVTAAACFAILVPFLLPSMHERYFYLADVLAVVVAFYLPRVWYVPLLVQTASALSYVPFLLHPNGTYLDRRLLSTLMLAALLVVGYQLLHDAGRTGLRPENEATSVPADGQDGTDVEHADVEHADAEQGDAGGRGTEVNRRRDPAVVTGA